jgi:predicted AlkP superfamily pyrophosphatase or phosphodiesterase
MKRTVVLDVVGLTTPLVERMPRLYEFAKSRAIRTIVPSFPAVTCTAQSTYLTGQPPSEHGIVGNGS